MRKSQPIKEESLVMIMSKDSETILIVDDEKEIADLLEVYLRSENYQIRKFYDPLEALSSVEKEPVSLAILDVMMPGMDGFTLCSKIRQKYLFPVIMLTAKGEDIDKIQGLTLQPASRHPRDCVQRVPDDPPGERDPVPLQPAAGGGCGRGALKAGEHHRSGESRRPEAGRRLCGRLCGGLPQLDQVALPGGSQRPLRPLGHGLRAVVVPAPAPGGRVVNEGSFSKKTGRLTTKTWNVTISLKAVRKKVFPGERGLRTS